jgi:hypothetical protein
MRQDREHPLYYLDAETLLVATYIWVDDGLKALEAQGLKLPPKQKHQKATLAELLTLAIFCSSRARTSPEATWPPRPP